MAKNTIRRHAEPGSPALEKRSFPFPRQRDNLSDFTFGMGKRAP